MAEPPDGSNGRVLRRVINTPQLWAIAVGLVISGEYFGWNYGWAESGTIGFLIATLLVTLLYITFIFSYTELTAAIPRAGGPFDYAHRAFGKVGGFVAAYASLVDFLMAPPAIAYALGNYAHFLNPAIPIIPTAVGMYVVFIGINYFGIKSSANFSLWMTLLAVVELLIFMAVIVPYFQLDNFVANNSPAQLTVSGVFAGLPYAVWFFVGIEGVAMVAEEVKNPHRTIPRGYILSILTLVLLGIGVMMLTGGIGDWRSLANIDHPLPQALSMTLGHHHGLTKIFTSLGLFGLIASFHCNTLSYSRQIYALARNGYLPSFLADINLKYKTPHWALISGGMVGLLAILVGNTSQIIIMSVLGAVVMYITSMASLFVLRQKEPRLERPFMAPFYPWFPAIAIVLSLLCLAAIIYFNFKISILFFIGLGISTCAFVLVGIRFVKTETITE
jgi:ethanolamine permease